MINIKYAPFANYENQKLLKHYNSIPTKDKINLQRLSNNRGYKKFIDQVCDMVSIEEIVAISLLKRCFLHSGFDTWELGEVIGRNLAHAKS